VSPAATEAQIGQDQPLEQESGKPEQTDASMASAHETLAEKEPTAAAAAPRYEQSRSRYDYIVIVGYLAVMLSLGIVFRKFSKNRDSADYFKGGSRTAWWMVGSSSFMTAFSAWTFTGAASQAYASGISISVIFIANTVGFFVNAAFLAAWYRQTRATTLPEILRRRFNVATQQVDAWLGVLFAYLMAGLHLWGISIFASTVFGFNITYVIIALGIVVVFYSTVGGSWSVMATDFVQTLILIPLTMVVTFLALQKIGGMGGFVSKINEMGLQDHLKIVESGEGAKFTLFYIAAVCLKQVLVYNGLNDAPKYFAVKTGHDARKAAFLAGTLMFFGSLFWFIPPIIARLQYSSVVESIPLNNPADAAYAVTSMQLLPTGLVGLMVVAMLAATMSSMDSSLNKNSAIFTRDIVKGLFFKNITERAQFFVGQIFTLVSGTIVILLALYFSVAQGKGIFTMMMKIGGLVAIPRLVPMLWGIFIKSSPQWAALISLGCALLMSVVNFVLGSPFPVIVFTNFAVGTYAFFAATLFAPAVGAYKKQAETFFKVMHMPVDFDKEVGGAVDTQQLGTIGITSVVISVFILVLMAIVPGDHSRLPFLFIAAFVGGVGALFLLAARKIAAHEPAPATTVPETHGELLDEVRAEATSGE
jgi:SSS family transporter